MGCSEEGQRSLQQTDCWAQNQDVSGVNEDIKNSLSVKRCWIPNSEKLQIPKSALYTWLNTVADSCED